QAFVEVDPSHHCCIFVTPSLPFFENRSIKMPHHDLPFQAEYAKSGRSSCKLCKKTISQDSLRLAVMVQVCLV
ncbi:unnamed protein product, partial [Lymnaea stagnalis]